MSMTIANRLKSLASKWGIESKSHTIEDVLEDLENGLPFSVEKKMVEIVPEQSVTGELSDNSYTWEGNIDDIGGIRLEANKEYCVIFNNVKYEVTSKNVGDDFYRCILLGDAIGETPDFSKYPFFIVEDGLIMIKWSVDIGKSITFAIYEEQEVVTPLDPKFVGASGICFKSDANGNLTCSHTYAEVRAIIFSGSPYSVCLLSYDENYGGWYCTIGWVNMIREENIMFGFMNYSEEIRMDSSEIRFESGEA